MADEQRPLFTDEERYLLDVQQRFDRAELEPDGPEARNIRDWARRWEIDKLGIDAVEARDALIAKWFPEGFPQGEWKNELSERKAGNDVTPEQKERVDQALGNVELSNQIGGAYEAGDKPLPNDPTPMDKAREIGNDLHRSGLTMDREK
jgi:hypothetical protein